MHVAIVTETYPPQVNGVALTVQALVLGLRQLGHEVSLLRPRQSRADRATDAHERLVAGATLPRYPGLQFGWPAGRLLTRTWRQARPDAIYVATEGPLGWSAVRSARNLGIPAITGFHTRFDDYAAAYGAAFLTPLVCAWLKRLHNSAAATVVPTRELQQLLQDRGFQRVEMVRRAVDTRLFDPARRDPALRASWGLGPDDLAVIHVGRLAAEKNLGLAVHSFRAIQSALRNTACKARFVMVGDGPERHALQAANPEFVFAGVQRATELATHYASGDLFLFPSLSETFGNVTLEAMASGVATIAFDYGAAHEHLRDGVHGAALPRDDDAGFVSAALRLAKDTRLRRDCGAAARAAVSGLSPDTVARDFASLLQRLAAPQEISQCA